MPSLYLTTILAFVASAVLPITASALPQSDLFKRDTIKTCNAGGQNQVWRSPSGATTWRLNCNMDTGNDGDHAVVPVDGVDGFENCIKLCGSSKYYKWCKTVSFHGQVDDTAACYLKDGNTGEPQSQGKSGWRMARKLNDDGSIA